MPFDNLLRQQAIERCSVSDEEIAGHLQTGGSVRFTPRLLTSAGLRAVSRSRRAASAEEPLRQCDAAA